MNDLKNGVLDINGFLVGPDTTVEELEEYFGMEASRSDLFPYRHFYLDGQSFINNDVVFKVWLAFNGKLKHIYLYPQFQDLIEKYNVGGHWMAPSTGDPDKDLAYFKEVRVILDAWLECQLGAPTYQNDCVTEYKIGSILLGTDSYVDERSRDVRVVGGTLDIYYR